MNAESDRARKRPYGTAAVVALAILGAAGVVAKVAAQDAPAPIDDGGTVEDGGPIGGAGPTDDGGPADEVALDAAAAEDVEAPNIELNLPADGATEVSILVEPTVSFDEALGEESLTIDALNDALLLIDDDDELVPGTTVYDPSTRSLIFTPTRPLAYDTRYRLEIAAVEDAAGNLSAPVSLGFRTSENPPEQRRAYVAGDLQGYERFDREGGRTVVSGVVGPGPDGDWLTADDSIAWRRTSYVDVDGIPRTIFVGGPGADGVWATTDDLVIAHVATITGDDGVARRVQYSAAGGDGVWFTDDDVPSGYEIAVLDRRGRPVEERTYWYAGGDGTWFTDDDVPARTVAYQYRGDELVAWHRVIGPGFDGVWDTDDDQIAYRATRSYDSRGFPARTVAYEHAGGDGSWGTEDDRIAFVVEPSFSAAGQVLREVVVGNPGFDGEWFTDDDQVTSYAVHDYDARGLHVATVNFVGAGPDGDWFTGDDLADTSSTTVFDSIGDRTMRRLLGGSGLVERVWTFDDTALP